MQWAAGDRPPRPAAATGPMIRPFERPCTPPLWARGGQAQTLLGFLLPTAGPDLATDGATRHEVEVGDGDRVVVLDAPPHPASSPGSAGSPGSPGGARPLDGDVVHLFHGLTGSSESNYVRLCAEALRRAGARVLAFNHRGQGLGEGLARGLYHSGSAPDLWASIAAARARYPAARHLAVGFSLSGNALLLGAGRDSGLPGAPDALLAVNPPVDLCRSVGRMERGVNRIYDRNFVLGVRRAVARRVARGELAGARRVSLAWNLRRTDHEVTAPLAGFASGAEYYARCSAAPWLGSVRLPAVILSAADDPFIDPGMIEEAAAGTSIQVHMEPTGGHLGYLARGGVDPRPRGIGREGDGFPGRRWLAAAVLHYVGELSRATPMP